MTTPFTLTTRRDPEAHARLMALARKQAAKANAQKPPAAQQSEQARPA